LVPVPAAKGAEVSLADVAVVDVELLGGRPP